MEIDEAFLTKSKYHVGRQLAKNDVIILGMKGKMRTIEVPIP